jgi:hypothetical protein
MPDNGRFVYTVIKGTETAGLGTGDRSVDGNGFVEKTAISGEVVIPNSINNYRIVSLLEFSVRNCNQITKLVLPDTLLTLEYGALTILAGIQELRFPASITTIKDYNDCYTNANKIVFERGSRCTSIGIGFCRYSIKVEELTIPSSVRSIASLFAQGCSGLKRVYYCGNEGDFSLIQNVFNGCQNTIDVFVSYEYNGTSFGGKSIIRKAFSECFNPHGFQTLCKYTIKLPIPSSLMNLLTSLFVIG